MRLDGHLNLHLVLFAIDQISQDTFLKKKKTRTNKELYSTGKYSRYRTEPSKVLFVCVYIFVL